MQRLHNNNNDNIFFIQNLYYKSGHVFGNTITIGGIISIGLFGNGLFVGSGFNGFLTGTTTISHEVGDAG
jgi:hypothetical protein